ncbi:MULTISPECIES: sensor histidine kinase [Nocardiopsis]|uniref:Integral membrane sensor signal transduction histidine kinase n=1 Tax=Nocardiopsis dassonvillei (strain ATCC 23218 / DSM 43111 / CIP 107115 / JCM 7437 / KCTC 9190 / NBRC 14626 / NCTC 10488 / NRRL B-5397 / IMRU 509) TaxID=446468 RepID=D7B9K1_NOCDD|nr:MULTISPECIES: histidine kinase [Nocardiopsis]ADH70859.1 integral membrane sensor signal transduction histidine kinase [Nocardiopsis dassonvillei subsp. dassonvillei DSM 43111]APC33469.1 two-component sensor histidine kinase [Nocardiopsis dassonvillei]NKY78100.1 two-component sensor histidine kinase [Nocardiopsis dassonvillei]VEI91069.1 Sensor histidine kinase desK [Nocardiopsis dassonvillei]
MSDHGTPSAEYTASDREGDRRVRFARRIVIVSVGFTALLVVGMPLVDVVTAAASDWPLWRSLTGVVASVPIAVLLIVMLRARLDGRRKPDPRAYWTSLGLIVVVVLCLQEPINTVFFLAAWWGTGVFLAPRRRSAYVTAALLALPWLAVPFYGFETQFQPLLYLLVWLVMVFSGLMFAGASLSMIWLWDISREAVAGQRARAQLAVSEERLRFARDMHDLLGHSLSALAVKAQLAGRLVERDPERAGAEMAEVQVLARQALQQVRSAVSGYREVDLAGETEAVRAVLDAGGTRAVATGLEGLDLPPRTAALAAWVVREGGTNVLRHSDANECQISFTLARDSAVGPRTLVVEVFNDRARGGGQDGRESGNGLAGLSERVAMGGGTLSAARTPEGGFLLRAVLPL